jgi:hypothetical protein
MTGIYIHIREIVSEILPGASNFLLQRSINHSKTASNVRIEKFRVTPTVTNLNSKNTPLMKNTIDLLSSILR